MQANLQLLSRRRMLEVSSVGIAALFAPLGCEDAAQAESANAKRPVVRAATPVTHVKLASRETANVQCAPVESPLGTEVPFNPKDRAFQADTEDFQSKRPPQPGEWLSRFHETGMSFDEYVASRPTQRKGNRNILVLQPIGPYSKKEREQLNELVRFTEAFFDSRVRLAQVAPLPKSGQRLRQGDRGQWVQHHTRRILRDLEDSYLPDDALCVLGVTMEDLYPEPTWNYVFGEATFEKRVGVYSLARYQARFWGERDTPESRRVALLRSFKVLAHETGHMFSLPHCRRYECLMNGSNSLEEMDRQTIEPCSVCLKMLQYNLRFDIRARYGRLMAIYDRNGLSSQRDWIGSRLLRIGCG
jgi:archaemetzincin